MSSEYPDILGDLVEAQQRFEVNGVHYLLALEPMAIAPGETTELKVDLERPSARIIHEAVLPSA